jgi:hypothetical protein
MSIPFWQLLIEIPYTNRVSIKISKIMGGAQDPRSQTFNNKEAAWLLKEHRGPWLYDKRRSNGT